MSFFDVQYYRFNKILLSAVGLWPYQRSREKLLTKAFGIFGLLNFSLPQILGISMCILCYYSVFYSLHGEMHACIVTDPFSRCTFSNDTDVSRGSIRFNKYWRLVITIHFQAIFVYKLMDNIDTLIMSLPWCAAAVLTTAKTLIVIYNIAEFKVLLDQLRDDWYTIRINEEIVILKKYAETGQYFTRMYTFFISAPISVALLSSFAAPILDIALPLNESRPRMLPHQADYLIDPDKNFYTILLSEYVATAIVVTIALGTDSVYIMFVEHVCGIFAIISFRLEHIYTDGKQDSNEEKSSCRDLVQCIKLHSSALKFVEMMNSFFAKLFLVDVGMGIFIHSAACVMIVIRMDRPNDLMKFIFIAMAESVRLFFSCWPGQKLMDHSKEVCVAAYNGLWYNAPMKLKKLLLFVIIRSQEPSAITVASIYTMNLDSFGMVMKTSLSYCTLMSSLHDRSKGA